MQFGVLQWIFCLRCRLVCSILTLLHCDVYLHGQLTVKHITQDSQYSHVHTISVIIRFTHTSVYSLNRIINASNSQFTGPSDNAEFTLEFQSAVMFFRKLPSSSINHEIKFKIGHTTFDHSHIITYILHIFAY